LGEGYLTSFMYVLFILAHPFCLCLVMIMWFAIREDDISSDVVDA